VPSGAEEYMTAVYGDFMKLPPVEDQTVKHNTVFVDLDNPYTKYKGIYYCVNNEGN
jgi:lipopolysaccharide cholinephosphotransferase